MSYVSFFVSNGGLTGTPAEEDKMRHIVIIHPHGFCLVLWKRIIVMLGIGRILDSENGADSRASLSAGGRNLLLDTE